MTATATESPALEYIMVPSVETYFRETGTAPAANPLRGGDEVWKLIAPMVEGSTVERFFAVYMDAKGKPLAVAEISRGTLTASLVHPREVFAPALALRAAAIVCAHNHPSGDPEPSAEDRAATRRLQRAGRLLGVELLDHVVIGRAGFVSFLERGWL